MQVAGFRIQVSGFQFQASGFFKFQVECFFFPTMRSQSTVSASPRHPASHETDIPQPHERTGWRHPYLGQDAGPTERPRTTVLRRSRSGGPLAHPSGYDLLRLVQFRPNPAQASPSWSSRTWQSCLGQVFQSHLGQLSKPPYHQTRNPKP